MINLIPIEEKKKIKKDFYYRFLVIFFAMLTSIVLISIILLFPAYLISLEKNISINQNLETQKNEIMPEIDQQAQTAIKELDTRLSLLAKARQNKYIFSEKVINEILAEKVSGIKIDKISYQNDPLDGKKIAINGIAQSREQLLLFRQALENGNFFKNVDLPISNFVEDTDIEFNLNLIPA
jgi:Tfp pilus assembly protein PilN